ncbi:MAG: HAD family hydrolase [Candidatus Doudnabacteria bacterium]
MIKLVAFDWNGTILSDTNAVVRAESATRLHFGLQATNLKEFQDQYDIPIKTYWIKAGFDPKVFNAKSHEIHLVFQKHYEPREAFCRTRSGTRGILAWLRSQKIKSIIFSNHIVPHIQKQARRLHIDGYFDGILARSSIADSSHMTAQGKAEKLRRYVQGLRLRPREVLTVGDTTEEIEIGRKFGYTTVALTQGYQSTARLKAAKPDFLIHNLKELKTIIWKNFSEKLKV